MASNFGIRTFQSPSHFKTLNGYDFFPLICCLLRQAQEENVLKDFWIDSDMTIIKKCGDLINLMKRHHFLHQIFCAYFEETHSELLSHNLKVQFQII